MATVHVSDGIGTLEPDQVKFAAVVVRVSTEEQTQNTSLDSQVVRCLEYASEHGYVVRPSDIYREEGVSGAKPFEQREALQAAAASLRTGSIDAMILVKRDRWFRDAGESLYWERKLGQFGDGVLFVEAVSFGNAHIDRIFAGFFDLFAEYERYAF